MLRILQILVNSNVYISLGAVLITIGTQVQLGMKPQWHPYLFIIFFATLFEYNLHRLVTVLTNKEALNDDRHSWVKKYSVLFYILVGFSILGFLTSLVLAKGEVLITLTPLALLTIFYSFPVLRRKEYFFRLREISFIKIFLISFVWSAITIFLPIIQSDYSFNAAHVTLIFIERFLFVFSITIPFDIRDIYTDKKSGLKTIPLLIGKRKSIILSNILILIFILISVFHYIKFDLIFISVALLLSALTTLYFINSKNIRQFRYYHYAILDGTLLLQGFLVFTSYFVNNSL